MFHFHPSHPVCQQHTVKARTLTTRSRFTEAHQQINISFPATVKIPKNELNREETFQCLSDKRKKTK